MKSIIKQYLLLITLALYSSISVGQVNLNTIDSTFQKNKFSISVVNGDTIYTYIPEIVTLRPQNSDTIIKKTPSKISKVASYSTGMDLSHIPESYSIDNTKDIGEISINQTAGNSSVGYSVPINVYQTPNGMNPTVQLVYNSMSGNGVAGYGWQIGGLSTISVTNSNIYFDGKPSPATTLNGGPFTLDGQRLINLNVGTSTETYFQTEQGNIKVTAFASYPVAKYFKVYYPNGNIATYGFTTNTSAKTSYPLTNITDLNGNTIDYTYIETNNVY